MKRRIVLYTLIYIIGITTLQAQQMTFDRNINGMQVRANANWLVPPVINQGTHDRVNISFDRMGHDYHPMSYHVEHCEADWQTSTELFDVDWLEGFNDLPIEDYAPSMNTTQPYYHYELSVPNEQTGLKLSGNYRVLITDEETGQAVAEVRFMICENAAGLALTATTNTDTDSNHSHQQLRMALNHAALSVTNPEEQLYTVVTKNQQWQEAVVNPRPDALSLSELRWEHCRSLIFPAGNEYRKFETLDVSHTTMGLARMMWDGRAYNAYPFADEARRNYLTDPDANGAFVIRNSDNWEISITCDYVRVNYELKMPPLPAGTDVVVSGLWATSTDPDAYRMTYDAEGGCYRAAIWQKQGYYNYEYRLRHADGTSQAAPTEGSFYQTENAYQAYVYYKGSGERTWRLVGFRQLNFMGAG